MHNTEMLNTMKDQMNKMTSHLSSESDLIIGILSCLTAIQSDGYVINDRENFDEIVKALGDIRDGVQLQMTTVKKWKRCIILDDTAKRLSELLTKYLSYTHDKEA